MTADVLKLTANDVALLRMGRRRHAASEDQQEHERLPLKDGRCPFRRSYSKPENPTSNMGAKAIEEQSRENARKNGKKLIFLRNFSIAEQDVVICNRVRCGLDPTWFRQRADRDRRYLRSLSVEEARLTATRKRSTSSIDDATKPVNSKLERPEMSVPEDEPFMDPPVNISFVELENVAARVTPCGKPEKYGATEASKLTSREKAMHGQYLIRESFANGAYGKVCAGEAVGSHQEVAVKIVPKNVLISAEEKQSVIRERIIHKALDHPHIIKLIDVFEDDGAHYFILERADHGALSTIISYAGLDEGRSREVFRQLLLALEYLHRNNIVHHDIKPHNVLLHHGQAKLCDFGASRAFNADQTSLPFTGIFGTVGYIAPELLMGQKQYGPPIDMFSAGVLLYEMVFGYAPFYPPSSCTYQPLEFPRKMTASPDLLNLLNKLLDKDPAVRITASQALGHPWLTMGSTGRSEPNSPVVCPADAGDSLRNSPFCLM